MNKRKQLHETLVGILGSRNVYFQPPATVKMKYPCIVYKRNKINTIHANDVPYGSRQNYMVIVIDSEPDSLIPEKVGVLPLCRFERHYTADNLNHDIYNIFY